MPLPSQMSREEFLAAFGGVFEHSSWIAEAAFEAGIGPGEDELPGLHAALTAVVEAADKARQLALVRAHPDLAGKLALAGKLTEASIGEQTGAGLDRLTGEEYELFGRLNAAYRKRFGFPFVMAVKGRDKGTILAALQSRIGNDPETEFRTALSQIERIAFLRLEEIFSDEPD